MSSSTSNNDRYDTLQIVGMVDEKDGTSDGILRDNTTSSISNRARNTLRAKIEGSKNNSPSSSHSSSLSRKKRSVPKATIAATAADPDNAFVYTTPPSNSSDGSNNNNYDADDDEDEEPFEMSIGELLYSSSSYYAIAKPVTLTMILAALAVCFINTDETREEGANAMASAYQVWNVNSNSSVGTTLATSLANAFVIVSVICAMTFVIVCLYHYKCMKFLIGYMVMCSCSLLGLLGGNLAQTGIGIYRIPVDKISFGLFMFNFAFVGVLAIFFGQGIPKVVTQGYLICTSVILAWHLSYFDEWTTWTLLFMLAVYDLCAVLTPCGPLKALVNLMSREDAPEMPGLLFEADLPPEAKRPSRSSVATTTTPRAPSSINAAPADTASIHGVTSNAETEPMANITSGRTVTIPLAIAKVYQLPVISIPKESMKIIFPSRIDSSNVSTSPLLIGGDTVGANAINMPEHLTPQQLRCDVTVQLPQNGGSIVTGTRRNKKVYYEHDRFNEVKRILWVDQRTGKVFAEMKSNDEESPEHNSIRLGLGDFIFYSVLVAKAAQYSFATFAVCALVILSGLGGTLVLLSVYGHALPALPISIFLGVIFYVTTRVFMEPYIQIIMSQPFYV
jgi:presenilin 1